MILQRFLPAAAMVVLTATAVAAAAPPARVLRTTTAVDGLAMDGSTVVISTAWSDGHCERTFTWDPLRASLRPLGLRRSCEPLSTGRGILEQAIAGSRVAWIRDGGGNHHDAELLVASASTPRAAHRLAAATRDIDSGAGGYVGHLRGEGSLLVYGTWSICDAGEVAFRPCPPGVAPRTIYNARLWRIDGTTGKQLLASAPDELAPVAVAGGRILVQRPGGLLEVLDARGAVVASFGPFGDGAVQQATLTPSAVVVALREATSAQPKARLVLQVYDLATAALIRTVRPAATAVGQRCRYPVGSSPAACRLPHPPLRLQDADAARLVYTLDTTVHVTNLANGSDRRYGTIGRAPILAQLEPAGLVYAYRTTTRLAGRVQFVPARELR